MEPFDLLTALHVPGTWLELRCGVGRDGPINRSTMHDTVEGALAAAEAHNGLGGVYFGVAPRRTREGGGAADNCLVPQAFWADIDPSGPEGMIAEGYYNAFLAPRIESELSPPSAVVHSGRGVQLYWFLDETLAADDWKARSRGVIAALTRALEGLPVNVDPVHDMPRIMRFPGTENQKNGNVSRVLALSPASRYSGEEFAPVGPTATTITPVDQPVGDGSRNSTLWATGQALKWRAGYTGQQLAAAMRALNQVVADPPWPAPELERLIERLDDPNRPQPLTVADAVAAQTESDVPPLIAQSLVNEIMSVRRGGRSVWYCWHRESGIWREAPVNGRVASWLHAAIDMHPDVDLLQRLSTTQKISGIVSHMAASDELPTYLEESALDTDPWTLPLRNCYLNLRTLETFAPDPAYRFTRRAEVDWNPEAQCPTWHAFLDQMVPSKDEQDYLGRVFYYCLSGDNRARSFFMNLGVGRNGKTVAWGVLREILGGFAAEGDHKVVTKTGALGSSHDAHIAQLFGLRLCIYDELNDNDELAAGQVKRLTGGTKARVRAAYSPSHEDIRLTAKHVLISNHRPQIQGEDQAVVDRLKYLAWDVRLESEQVDPDMQEKLLAERDGILQWILSHAEAFHADPKLPMPERLGSLAEAYAEEENDYLRFVRTYLHAPAGTPNIGLSASVKELGRKWEELMGEKLHGRGWNKFARELVKQLELLECQPILTTGREKKILGVAIVEPGDEVCE